MHNRKIIITASVITISILALVIADYFSMFGVKNIEKYDLAELNFTTIDEVSGLPVSNVKARCFQKKNNNACTQRESGEFNTVSINIPVQKIITKSMLFEQAVKIKETADPKLHIMFIHKNYANPVETVYIEELMELKNKNITIKMPKSVRNQ